MTSLDTIRLDLEHRSTTYWDILSEEDIRLIHTQMDTLWSLLDTSYTIDRYFGIIPEECEEIERCFHIISVYDYGHFLNHICMYIYPCPYKYRARCDMENTNIFSWRFWDREVLYFHIFRDRKMDFFFDSIIEDNSIFCESDFWCADLVDIHAREYRERVEKDKVNWWI